MAHKNFDSLRKAILAKAKNSISKGALDYIKDEMTDAIESEVYDVYKRPYSYIRRRGNGGLLDRKNIIGKTLNDNKNGFNYEVSNNTKTNFSGRPKIYLTPLVVLGQKKSKSHGYGSEYLYYPDSEDKAYGKPRDFIGMTKKNINKKEIVSRLEQDMKR